VQVQLVTGVVLGPGHLLKPIGLGVNELGVLGNRLVGVPVKHRQNRASTGKSQRGKEGELDAEMKAGHTFASSGTEWAGKSSAWLGSNPTLGQVSPMITMVNQPPHPCTWLGPVPGPGHAFSFLMCG